MWPGATSSFNDDSCRASCPCSRILLTSLHVNDDFPFDWVPEVHLGQRVVQGFIHGSPETLGRPRCDKHMIRETNDIRANHLPPTAVIKTPHSNNRSGLIGCRIWPYNTLLPSITESVFEENLSWPNDLHHRGCCCLLECSYKSQMVRGKDCVCSDRRSAVVVVYMLLDLD